MAENNTQIMKTSLQENMDYLKCPEKIAAGASGCK